MTTPQDIMRMEQDIVLTLKNIYDPEIPVNIYDLGLFTKSTSSRTERLISE